MNNACFFHHLARDLRFISGTSTLCDLSALLYTPILTDYGTFKGNALEERRGIRDTNEQDADAGCSQRSMARRNKP